MTSGVVLAAPASFRDTLTAAQAAAAMAAGAARASASIRCDVCPVADGGEGSLDVLVAALGAVIHHRVVTGPLGEPVEARFATTPAAARGGPVGLVELAEASGLRLVPPPRRDPTATTTFGTGQLIAAAAAQGCGTVIVCIGGSATVDGGAGIAQALGGRFTDAAGRTLPEPLCGGRLGEVAGWRAPERVPALRVACDVTSPLLGPAGAAAVYAPQKGATPAQVAALEQGLRRLAAVAGGAAVEQPGAGAAGGAGWGMAALLGARLDRGIDLVLDAVGFTGRCRRAGLVLTGEGSLDRQTLAGKACAGVARAAAAVGVPVIAIAGRVVPEPGLDRLFARIVSLADLYGPEPAMARAAECLAGAATRVLAEAP